MFPLFSSGTTEIIFSFRHFFAVILFLDKHMLILRGKNRKKFLTYTPSGYMSTKIVRRRAHIKKRQSDFSNRRNIFYFLTEQAFFIAIAAMDTIAPLTFLAFALSLSATQ